MKIMVSACLCGVNCKYNGGNNLDPRITSLASQHQIIKVCPEVLGGMKRPHEPAEIVDGRVMTRDGKDETEAFVLGAEKVLELAKKQKPDIVILQSRSPSCGVRQIYDGTFSGKLISGMGITAKLLKKNGFRVIDAADISKINLF